MDNQIDPEELVLLQRIFALRERAVQALLADQLSNALTHAEEALQESTHLKEPDAVPPLLKDQFASLLYRIGRELAKRHCLDDAVRALRLVVEIERRVGNPAGQASVLSDMATLHLEAERAEEAIQIYKGEVLPLRLELKKDSDIRSTQRNIGLAYLRLEDADASYSYLLKSLETKEGQLPVEETTKGLQTVLAAQKNGLVIPPSLLEQFRIIAETAGLTDLERRFESPALAAPSASFKRIKVFISYSHADRQQVGAIRQFMPSQLFDVFFDRDRLYAGWTWEPILLQTIQNADVFVLLIGAETLERDYVNKELDTFLATRQKPEKRGLIPVLIDGCREIPHKVAAYQALDLRGGDAQMRARSIGQAIHGAFFVPDREMINAERRPSEDQEKKVDGRMKQLWESGQIGLSPKVASQMLNLGIVKAGIYCAHGELDTATMQPKPCQKPAAVVCVACVTGACDTAFHMYGRFCTLLPPGDPFSPGTKLFYWCGTCHGPVCTRCLQIEDDYPCSPERVLSYRFLCPSCGGQIQVVPVLNVDMEGVAREFLRWARAGGPPDMEK